MKPVLVWFRNDLRLSDNPALTAALKTGCPIVPMFLWSPHEEADWAPGGASRWWLHHSLLNLNKELKSLGSRLVLRRGESLPSLESLISETKATHVFWNRRYEPAIIERDKKINSVLREKGLTVESFNGSLLVEPWEIKTGAGNPYQVFTPFWKACQAQIVPRKPLPTPKKIPAPPWWPDSDNLDSWHLLPGKKWAAAFPKSWTPGEQGAQSRLKKFLNNSFPAYSAGRDFPHQEGTSRLSPHLHFGEMSPRKIWFELQKSALTKGRMGSHKSAEVYLAELGWREFAHHLLFHFPQTPAQPLRNNFDNFPWIKDPVRFKAWKKGLTGYPLVDAGMRELWTTGWMHNRVRMVVASFLVKDLQIDWREGAQWFWDTLVDADLANNTLGWQWSAGCGADAAPYFRIFNPISQSEKFDFAGGYIRKWIPELKNIPDKFIHKPWECPVKTDYPSPIVDHAQARVRALAAFEKIKR